MLASSPRRRHSSHMLRVNRSPGPFLLIRSRRVITSWALKVGPVTEGADDKPHAHCHLPLAPPHNHPHPPTSPWPPISLKHSRQVPPGSCLARPTQPLLPAPGAQAFSLSSSLALLCRQRHGIQRCYEAERGPLPQSAAAAGERQPSADTKAPPPLSPPPCPPPAT